MRPTFPILRLASAALLSGAALAACSFAPDYHVPDSAPVVAYKEAPAGATDTASDATPVNVGFWTTAQPADGAARDAWWRVFGDPALDDLEARAGAANQNLAAAVARYRQARTVADIAGADLFPVVNLTTSAVREHTSQFAFSNSGSSSGSTGTGGSGSSGTSSGSASNAGRTRNDFVLRAQTSYEIDFWGRVRNAIAAARSRVQASAADLATAQLSIQAELAGDYFELRGMDAQTGLLEKAVDIYQEALRITRNRYDGGVAAIVDVDQAQTQLETAQVQLADSRLSRSQMEHAIAILTGAVPAAFTLAPEALTALPPRVASGLPSQLLQRRPDIAGAERQVFAANAEIGVTRAAWFPAFTLNALFGFESLSASHWIEAPARMWSIGPSVVLTIFDGGLRHAQNEQAIAAFDETVANYRQTVLGAYGEVEDQLAAIRWLDVQTDAQGRAVDSSQRSLDQANYRYKGGIATFLEVVSTQNTALQAQQAAVNLRVRRLNASLQLIKALGGGWDGAQLDQPAAIALRPSPRPAAP